MLNFVGTSMSLVKSDDMSKPKTNKLFVLAVQKNYVGVVVHQCKLKTETCKCYLLNVASNPTTQLTILPINFVANEHSKPIFDIGVENWESGTNLPNQLQFFCCTNTSPTIPNMLKLTNILKFEIANTTSDVLVLQFMSPCDLICFVYK